MSLIDKIGDSVLLYQGDCLEEMNKIPDGTVGLVLCDPPYGTTTCKWDTVIPFKPMWEQIRRVSSGVAATVMFSTQPFTSALVLSNAESLREDLVWLKNRFASGFMHGKRHMKVHEQILVFSDSPNFVFNPQKWMVDKKEFITQRKTFDERYVGNNIYSEMYAGRKVDTGERNPLSVVSCRIPFTPQNSKTYSKGIELRVHPTQKPIALLEYLIATYTNEGDTVLDFAMGSGSTGVACANTGRKFIGIELDENYYHISKKRIEEALHIVC